MALISVGTSVVYRWSQQRQETIKIYKSVDIPTRDRKANNSSIPLDNTTTGLEENTNNDTSERQDTDDLSVADTNRSSDTTEVKNNMGQDLSDLSDVSVNQEYSNDESLEDLLQIRDDIVSEDLSGVIQDLRDNYPLLRMSENELLEMSKTESGRAEITRQSEEIFSTITNSLADSLIMYTAEEREVYYQQARSILSQSMPADQIDKLLNATIDAVESRIGNAQ